MNRLYLVELPSTPSSTHETIPQMDKAPVCIDCANGYHEQLVTDNCSCPCHGDSIKVTCEVAA